LIGEGDVPITVSGPGGGGAREVTLRPVSFDEHVAWAGDLGVIRLAERPGLAYVADLDTIFSWRPLEGGSTVYLRWTQMRAVGATELQAIRDRVASGGVERVVLDIRQNPGGDNHNVGPVLALLKDPAIDREGRLFVLTDHSTFSAASNLATQIEQQTTAIFAGQPMAGGLNFWNDVQLVRLPHYPIPMQVGVSTRYWQFAPADDPRLSIEPDLPLPNLSSDYFGDRDPVLEAVLARPVP
jgi:C-terminal processing protease CtpA/Prc